MTTPIKHSRKRERGQSLVELALILPILLVVLAGTVEVSNILITKNRVETSARAAARHAANGGDDSHIVVLNSVTQTLDLSPDLWDIWAIDAKINDTGTDFDSGDWTISHLYGLGHTSSYTDVANRLSEDCTSNCISTRILHEFQQDSQTNSNNTIAEDLEFVGVFVTHDIESILGLNALPAYQGFTSVEGLGFMRTANLSVVDTTEGCAVVFPFGVSDEIRSIEQAFYNNIKPEMDYPTTAPDYYSFSYHNSNTPLYSATDGDIFRYSFTNLDIAWLRWNPYLDQSPNNLAGSLEWPGNSFNYNDCTAHGCSGSPLPPYPHPVWGFSEAGDANDQSIHVNDRVTANLGGSLSSNNVTAELRDHINNYRALRIPIFEEDFPIQYLADGTPYYEVRDFGIFRIRGYSVSDNWILLEFVRLDSSCGR